MARDFLVRLSVVRDLEARSVALSSAAFALFFFLILGQSRAFAAECKSDAPAGPMTVTATCEDPVFNASSFVIDKVSKADSPAPHTRVDGHFVATPATPEYKVSIYLPSAKQWRGRFFQHAYPLAQPENTGDIAFALANGGYLVHVQGTMCGCGGYRPDAAAAKLAKEYARKFYKNRRRIYGYIWGGSGGGFLVVGAIENTIGVWDGAVPYVMPNAGSVVNVNSAGALAELVLRDKLPAIAEDLQPGSTADPFAALTDEQRAELHEILRLGVPLRTFETQFTGGSVLLLLSNDVRTNDSTYVDDFWGAPGYEGLDPPGYLQRAKIDEFVTITDVTSDADGVASITVDNAPAVDPADVAGLDLAVYDADGKSKLGTLNGRLQGNTINLRRRTASGTPGKLGMDLKDASISIAPGAASNWLSSVSKGDKVRIDNLFYLAMHYYYRHALPSLREEMHPYDQFRNADGSPRYPQRSFLSAEAQAVRTAGGGTQTGNIHTKTIVNQSILDSGALPWMADWYAQRVRKALGDKAYKNNFRLWFNDNAEHTDSEPRGAGISRVIHYTPSLYQSLRDLIAWCEHNVAPPSSSHYTVEDGQIHLLAKAKDRGGIQPVVDLRANSAKRIEVSIGQPVEFVAQVEVPPGAGKVTSCAWWFGEDEPVLTPSPLAHPRQDVELRQSHVYVTPGTYFVTLRVTSQREGNIGDSTTAIQNLDRVAVVVH